LLRILQVKFKIEIFLTQIELKLSCLDSLFEECCFLFGFSHMQLIVDYCLEAHYNIGTLR
jgi:hypothetical protein